MFKCSSSTSALSNLSLDSISDDDLEPWHGLIQKLSVLHLEPLHAIFKNKSQLRSRRDVSDKGLSKEDFIRAIDEVFGNCKHSLQASLLFARIDQDETNEITWDQFLDFVIEDCTAEAKPSVEFAGVNIFNPPHVKRDTIAKMVLIETEKYFCYAILSKYGHVGLYDGNMNFLTSYRMIMTREDIARKEEERRRRNRWVTDAIFAKDILMLFVATSTRSIAIYDVSGLTHVPLWLILGIPNIIEKLAWFSDYANKHHILFMGDEKGQLTSITFLRFNNELMRKKHNDKLNFYYWIQLHVEKDFVLIKNYGRLHNEGISRMYFCPEKNIISTCSKDSDQSVILKPLNNKMNNYVFKMHRGATCYALSNLLRTLITGSSDGVIRIWNVVVTLKPTALLKSHSSSIVDIQIMETQELFLSCCNNAILKLWSIKDQHCLQSLNIKFPSFQILGKTIEWGCNAIHPGPKREMRKDNDIDDLSLEEVDDVWKRSHIFISCCNHLAEIKFIFHGKTEGSMVVLPPPPLQNSVLVPKHWKISDNIEDIEISSPPHTQGVDDEIISEHLESLKFILEKDILVENNLHSDINYRLACVETQKLKMKPLVAQCAPYLTLNLPVIEEIKLSPNLPLPNSKRMRNLVDKTLRLLSESGTKSHASFEQSSSSRTQSSRSSIITFE
ncbi:hypothetical protein RN001_000387 [Aquatica leii]|uniref:WD repeat-containing protein on Y chromosome n=1 Tax=Aquatica leii TaxID=1421715 RepID=A0AAN7SC71_9COLE|nr:hypothetical protein RN001_000387 [Aquatica leii]